MDFKHCRWSTLVWQGYCSSPIPWWRKHAYKNRSREKSLFTRQKVRKKERTIHQHTGADRNIHTHHVHTSHHNTKQQPEGNSICGQRFQSLAAQRKRKSKYCQCPVVTSWINYFLFVEFHFVLGTGFSVVRDTCFKNSAFSGLWGIISPLCPGWSVWPDGVCWIAVMSRGGAVVYYSATQYLINSAPRNHWNWRGIQMSRPWIQANALKR